MNENVVRFLRAFFDSIWHIFESIPIPGTNFNCAELTIGLLGATAFIVVLRKVIDDGGAVGFRSAEGKHYANKFIFGHKKYYGGSKENKLYHEGD